VIQDVVVEVGQVLGGHIALQVRALDSLGEQLRKSVNDSFQVRRALVFLIDVYGTGIR